MRAAARPPAAAQQPDGALLRRAAAACTAVTAPLPRVSGTWAASVAFPVGAARLRRRRGRLCAQGAIG